MIVYAMLFTVAVGVPIACAAWALAAVLRRDERPERAVWLGALLLTLAIPIAVLAGSSRVTAGLLDVLVVSVGGASIAWEAFVVALWSVLSATLLVRWARGSFTLRSTSREWLPASIDGYDVQVTDDVGPTVAGVFNPRILAPAWLVTLPEPKRSLLLEHEQEHIRAGDQYLVAVARAACVVLPWNPVVWMLSFRLVRATDRDCGRRVRRRSACTAPSENALLDISAPGRSHPAAAATMASVVLGVSLFASSLEIPVPPLRMRVELGEAPVAPAVAATALPRGFVASVPDVREWQSRPRTIATGTRRPPRLLNQTKVRRTLLEEYPADLRARGIGGAVLLAVLVGPDGKPVDRRLDWSSGHAALDEAALAIVEEMRFAPARRQESQTSVWVDQRIAFRPGAPDPTRIDHHAAP